MPADINQQATPRKARLVFDRDRGRNESLCSNRDQLQKSLQAVKRTEGCGSRKLRARLRNRELVRFVLAELLHGFEALLGVHSQCCGRADLRPEWNTSLKGKLRNKPLHTRLKRGIMSTRHADGERLSDWKRPGARLNAGRYRHPIDRGLRLRD